MRRAHLRRYGALDRPLNVQRVRLACGHRAPPRSWTLLIALARFLRQAPSGGASTWRPPPPGHSEAPRRSRGAPRLRAASTGPKPSAVPRLSRPPSLVLASASPRRQELLAQLGIPFTVLPSHIPEEHPAAPATEAIAAVALAKARAVALRLSPDA